MDNNCARYAVDIISMISQIKDKLTVIKAANEANNTKKYNDLLTLFYNSFALNYTLIGTVKPSNCNDDILSFMNNVISENPTWVKPAHKQMYINTLQNKEVVAIIGEVQKKINEKGLFKVGGGHSFKKRTTSTRKSIKRSCSRSNRRSNRRTARK